MTVAKQLALAGCHRVCIVDIEGEIVGIASQSCIIRFLNTHRNKLGTVGSTTVGDVATCGTSPVLSVQTTQTVLDALRVMSAHDLLGLAVVDATNGRLVANTLASDFKHLLQDPSATSMDMPIVDFLSRVRGHDVTTAEHAPAMVRPSDTLAQVVAQLATHAVHRVYVVGETGAPARVISLTDILAYIYRTSVANFPSE